MELKTRKFLQLHDELKVNVKYLQLIYIYIYTAAIDKTRASSQDVGGLAGAHTHLTLSHASYHQLTRPIVNWWSWTPAVYPHGHRSRRRCCHDGTNDPLRHQQYRHAAGATRTGVPPRCCRRMGHGPSDSTTHPPHPLTNHATHSIRTHIPPRRVAGDHALLDRGIHQRHLIP
jgi:hypothetical protein